MSILLTNKARIEVSLSRRVADLEASPIRDILEAIERPDMISFAGGLPANSTFLSLDKFSPDPADLQYGASEGELALRQQLAEELNERGIVCDVDQVIVLSGSQQGIDLVAKLFIDPATRVAVESPTYLAALQAFRFFGAQFCTYDPAAPANLLPAIRNAAFAYVIPNFQNPSGKCYSSVERSGLAAACDAHSTVLFEDDPYRDLVYEPCDRRPIVTHLKRTSWIYQGSFSKSFAPGLRLGYLVCSRDLTPYFVRLKQAADLHSNRVSQAWILRQLQDPMRESRMAQLVQQYRSKRACFHRSLRRHFADLADWSLPQGGLFFWLKLRAGAPIDTRPLLAIAVERDVAFMPGEPFFADGRHAASALRLNFSHAEESMIDVGLERLASIVRSKLGSA